VGGGSSSNSSKPTHLDISISGLVQDTINNKNFITCIDFNNDNKCYGEKIFSIDDNKSFTINFNNISNTSHVLLSQGSENNKTNKKYNGSYMRIIDISKESIKEEINTTITPLSTIVAHIYKDQTIFDKNYKIDKAILKVATYFDLTLSQVLSSPLQDKKLFLTTTSLMNTIIQLQYALSPDTSNIQLRQAFDFVIKGISKTINDSSKTSKTLREVKSPMLETMLDLVSSFNDKIYNDKKIIVNEAIKITISNIHIEAENLISITRLEELESVESKLGESLSSLVSPNSEQSSGGGGGGGGGGGKAAPAPSINPPSLSNIVFSFEQYIQPSPITFVNSGGSATSCSSSSVLPSGLNDDFYKHALDLPKGLSVKLTNGTCSIVGVPQDVNNSLHITSIIASNGGGSHTSLLISTTNQVKIIGVKDLSILKKH